MVTEARFRIRHHGCWTESLTGAQHVTLISLDAERCVAVMHGENEEQVEAFIKARVRDFEDAVLVDRAPGSVVLRCIPRPGGVIMTVFAFGCSILWPVLNSNGHETYTIVAPSRERLSALLDRLKDVGDVTLEKVSEVNPDALAVTVPLSDITSGLTEKQLSSLELAIKSGYYDSPRRTSAEGLAKAFGVSRSTYEEHLRKAERQVLERFAGLLAHHPALARAATRGRGRPPRS